MGSENCGPSHNRRGCFIIIEHIRSSAPWWAPLAGRSGSPTVLLMDNQLTRGGQNLSTGRCQGQIFTSHEYLNIWILERRLSLTGRCQGQIFKYLRHMVQNIAAAALKILWGFHHTQLANANANKLFFLIDAQGHQLAPQLLRWRDNLHGGHLDHLAG